MIDSPVTTLSCTQCGGELHPDEGQIFVTCPFCSATVYVDRSQVVFHWYLAPTLDEAQAAAMLSRWMSGNQTVKDLDRKAKVVGQTFQYFPLWFFKFKWGGEHEEIELELAAATSVTELKQLTLPGGDLRRYEASLESQSVTPSVPLEASWEWVRHRHAKAEIQERSLVHIPIYTFKYIYQNKTYTVVVEAATGRVLANIYPPKAEAPYLLAGGLVALVYLCLAVIPLIGYASDKDTGLFVTLPVVFFLALLAAPLLFILAVWVASKV